MEAKSETNKQYPVSCLSCGQEGRHYCHTHWYMPCTNLLQLPPLTEWISSGWTIMSPLPSCRFWLPLFKVLCHRDSFRIEARGPVEVHGMLRSPCRTRFSLLRITPPNPLMCLPYSSTDWHWDACGESSSVS